MSEAKPIRKVVIVGRDEALWLAASILRASFHRTPLDIVAVELPTQRRFIDVIPPCAISRPSTAFWTFPKAH